MPDELVGAIALDVVRKGSSPLAATLLANAKSVEAQLKWVDQYEDYRSVVTLVLPLDYMDQLDDQARRAIRAAAERADISCDLVQQRLAPAAPGWRDKLAEIEDWGAVPHVDDRWVVINERVTELKALFDRSITPDDLADVGRRCRELMVAAVSATYRPVMLPKGEDEPKEGDAKTKARYIIQYVGSNSLDERLSKLIDKAWDLSVGLLHHDEPARTATYAAAQSAILVVRTLGVIEADIRTRSEGTS